MFVAASSRCFLDLPLDQTLDRMVDLEFSSIEICIDEAGRHLSPDQIVADPVRCVRACLATRRVTPVAYYVDIDTEHPQYFERFGECCRLAKATNVVTVVTRAAELGTPINEEIERLQQLVHIGLAEGIVVALVNEVGRMTEDPDTAKDLCNNVNKQLPNQVGGLGISLDPSYFIYGPLAGCNMERQLAKLLPFVRHVRLRDTQPDQLQVRIGQGDMEYGRLITQLRQSGYRRALCVDIQPMPGVEQSAELRKLRRLLESLT